MPPTILCEIDVGIARIDPGETDSGPRSMCSQCIRSTCTGYLN